MAKNQQKDTRQSSIKRGEAHQAARRDEARRGQTLNTRRVYRQPAHALRAVMAPTTANVVISFEAAQCNLATDRAID